MSEQVILWYIPMSSETASRMLKTHKAAFQLSGCSSCPGLCCKDCGEEEGYLNRDDLEPGQIRYLKGRYGWTKARGFSGETGCNLPPEKRSTTCISFWCGQRKNSFMATDDTPGNAVKGFARATTLEELESFQDGLSHLIGLRTPESIKEGMVKMNAATIYKLWAKAIENGMGSHIRLFAKLIIEEESKTPIDMVLHCPACGTQHIDKADEVCEVCGGRPSACNAMGHRVDRSVKWAWLNEPHRSHQCLKCFHIWRPADVPTNGVLAVKTRGKHDTVPQAEEPAVIDGTFFSQRNKVE